jgi:hypothetical protein
MLLVLCEMTELLEQQWTICHQSIAQVALDQGAQQTVTTCPGALRGVRTCCATRKLQLNADGRS